MNRRHFCVVAVTPRAASFRPVELARVSMVRAHAAVHLQFRRSLTVPLYEWNLALKKFRDVKGQKIDRIALKSRLIGAPEYVAVAS
jgi:hypothetical protein